MRVMAIPPGNRSILSTALLLALGLIPSGRLGASLRDDGLNHAEARTFERGYYEQLLDTGRRLDLPAPAKPAPFDAGRLCDVVDDLREYVLKPNLKTTHRDASWTTNALGMRDREYPAAKPSGVVRIALVGDSIGSGWGVDDGRGFESLLEGALDSRSKQHDGPAVEVLNFSVPGHAPGQRWEHFRRVGMATDPDLVIFEATPADPGWDERRLRGLLARGVGWDAPQYREALDATKARPGGDFDAYKRLLRDAKWSILENVYRNAASECRARKIPCVWVLVPRVGKAIETAERERLRSLARGAGFDAVIDLTDAFDGIDPTSLTIAPDDFHPNARGHERLATRLEAELAACPCWRAIEEGRK